MQPSEMFRAGACWGCEFPINMAFGGDDLKTLFFVTRTTLGAVKLKIAGEPVSLRKV